MQPERGALAIVPVVCFVAAALAAVATVAAIVGAFSNSSVSILAAHLPTGAAATATRAQASPSETGRAGSATSTFRASVTADADRLVADVAALSRAVAGGSPADARTAELAAQGDFDHIRFVDAASPANVAALDDLAGQVLPGGTFGGLHAVEEDLWSGVDPGPLLSSLATQVAVAHEVVARQALSPVVVASVGVQQLDWVVDEALPGREEAFSRLDMVDVAAGVDAAREAFAAIRPLSCSLDPRRCHEAEADLGSLGASVSMLGPPATIPDSTLSVAVQHSLGVQADRAADALAALEPDLAAYGTTGPEPYGAGTSGTSASRLR